ncbi:MAG: putative sugar nucleotidyl transferase [Planctomycetota bacterium]
MRIEVFDDSGRPALPMLRTRGWAATRVGAWTVSRRVTHALASMVDGNDTWWVNGRWLADVEVWRGLSQLPVGRCWRVGDRVVAARVTDGDAMTADRLRDLPGEACPGEARWAEHAGDVLDALPGLLVSDLEAMGGSSTSGARVHATAVLDESTGPVRLEPGVVVGALAVIEGPCWVGADAVIQAHAHLRPNTSIGRACKVGGEVAGSVVHDFSNKAHYGYLGDSIVGSWCNLGAGTTTSNLKNTYGTIRLADTPDGERTDTGRTRLGAMMGDYVLTGIGTMLSSGTWIEPVVSLATSRLAPKRVEAFSFVTDDGDALYDFDAWRRTAETMAGRRGQALDDAYLAVMLELYNAAAERGVSH